MQTLKFSELTAASLKAVVKLQVDGGVSERWEQMNVTLTRQERQHLRLLTSYMRDFQLTRMNEATIWARAIYPLLMLAERPGVQAWSQVEMAARYRNFALEGIADGVLAKSLLGDIEAPYLIVTEAKKSLDAKDPQYQLLGQMLAGAWINYQNDRNPQQEIYGCYTIADNWTFFRALVEEIEGDMPAMTVESSREYAEKIEAEKIFQILKCIAGRFVQELADAA